MSQLERLEFVSSFLINKESNSVINLSKVSPMNPHKGNIILMTSLIMFYNKSRNKFHTAYIFSFQAGIERSSRNSVKMFLKEQSFF